ncbi:hypothetical protein L7F22_011708 [Adiantum nelumboides]|nr:hypothetical protein [Adiantum nelumboides]
MKQTLSFCSNSCSGQSSQCLTSHNSAPEHSNHNSGHDSSCSQSSGYNSSHSSGHDSSCSHSTGHNNSHTSKHGSSHGKGRKLNLDEFLQRYRLFEDETKAIIFVVDKRITPDDEKLMELAVENRKFFCIVCTHADNLVQVVDRASQKFQLDQLEEELRKDLSLVQSLNVRIFIVCIPCPEGQVTVSPDLTMVNENIGKLQFPLLQAYLSQPRGLLDELQIHSFVKEEVCNALEPFVNVKKRHQALDFSQHLVAGTLIPIAGPVMVSFLKTMRYTLKACSEVGLIEDADDAMNKVSEDLNKHRFSAKIASKEGMITAVHDSLIHIFGAVVFEIAIAEVVSTAAEAALHGALPLVGPAISAAHLPGRFKKIGEKLASKACMLHELWIMQNVTGLLGKTVG